MKTLWILRHAKAEPGDALTSDEQRTLAIRGREACEHLAAYIKKKGYAPQQVLCSTAMRTRETLSLIMPPAGWPTRFEKDLYLATAEEMLTQLYSLDESVQSVLLVGHNPGLHHLAAMLASDRDTVFRHKLELKFPTGTLAMLRFDGDDWHALQPGSGEISDLVMPSEL